MNFTFDTLESIFYFLNYAFITVLSISKTVFSNTNEIKSINVVRKQWNEVGVSRVFHVTFR